MQVLNNFDIDSDFWAVNPQLKIPFKDVVENPDSSKYMWALCLQIHPDSKFFNLTDDTRKELISQDYFEVDWEDEEVEKHLEKLHELVLSKQEKFLVNWAKKLEEREAFIGSLEYNSETYEMLDKMMAGTQKMWTQYMKCVEDVNKEKQESTFGGAQESLTEKGII